MGPHQDDPIAQPASNEAGGPAPVTPGIALDCNGSPAASVAVDRVWEIGLANYGQMGPGVFGIAPDASEIIVSGNELSPILRHFRASDGAQTSSESFPAIWRDTAWTIQGERSMANTVRSLVSGLPITTLPAGSNSIASGDGHRVLTYSCPVSTMTVQALDVPSASVEASQVIQGGCAPDNLVATNSGDSVLFTQRSVNRDDLHRLELATGAHTSTPTPAPVSNPTGDNPAITLSHGERSVATVGRDAVLRLWSYPALERIGNDIPTLWTATYLNCYCSYHRFAPVAWSWDDALLALSDADGNTVIRRACDGAVLTTVPSPTPTMRSPYDGSKTWAPIFLAFGPRDETLAVFYEGSLSLYRVRRSL